MNSDCPMCAEIGAHCGRHEEASAEHTPDTPECASCARSQGLCQRHARGILPQLAQPFWYRHAHSGLWSDEKEQAVLSQAGRKIARRKAMKERRRRELAALVADLSTLPPAA
jgi:hypothetical protein